MKEEKRQSRRISNTFIGIYMLGGGFYGYVGADAVFAKTNEPMPIIARATKLEKFLDSADVYHLSNINSYIAARESLDILNEIKKDAVYISESKNADARRTYTRGAAACAFISIGLLSAGIYGIKKTYLEGSKWPFAESIQRCYMEQTCSRKG